MLLHTDPTYPCNEFDTHYDKKPSGVLPAGHQLARPSKESPMDLNRFRCLPQPPRLPAEAWNNQPSETPDPNQLNLSDLVSADVTPCEAYSQSATS